MHAVIHTILLATLSGAIPIQKDAHHIIARSPQLGGLGGGLGGGSTGGLPNLGGSSSGGLGGLSGSLPSGLPGLGGGSGSFPGLGAGAGGGSLPTTSFPIPTPGSSSGTGGLSSGLPGIGGGSSSGGLPSIGGGSSSGGLGSGSGSLAGIGGGSSTGTTPPSLPFPSRSGLPSFGGSGGEPEAGPPFSSGNNRPDGPHPLESGSSSDVIPPEESESHIKRQLGSPSSSTPAAGASTGGLGGLGGSASGLGGGSSTASDVQNGKCAPVTFIFARGTSESGNVGSVVGPPLISDLQQTLGANNVAAQGVNYPADFSGNVPGGDTTGKQSMTDLANQALQQCPTTQLVLSGYSQGAIVAHDTMAGLPAATAQKVKAVVTFGDPDSTQAVKQIDPSNVKVYCASGDAVCEGTADITPAHLSYGDDAQPAAQFIAGKVQVSK